MVGTTYLAGIVGNPLPNQYDLTFQFSGELAASVSVSIPSTAPASASSAFVGIFAAAVSAAVTLVMQTLSIAQERIVLAVFLMLIAAAVVWQDARDSGDYSALRFHPTHAFADSSAIDFTSAEAAWHDLQIDSQGNLQIDALTESALLDAMALLDGPDAEVAMTRMALLLEKQFGATAAREITELLPRLQRYKSAEERWWAENGGRNPPPHAELFQLQDELLGEALAEKLFSEQRRLMNLMLTSQQMRHDASVTPGERAQAQRREASVE